MRSDVLSRVGGWAIVVIGAAVCPVVMQAQLPTWVIDSAARPVLKQLWASSVAARAERVACLAGSIAPDTVWITDAMRWPAPANLSAPEERHRSPSAARPAGSVRSTPTSAPPTTLSRSRASARATAR